MKHSFEAMVSTRTASYVATTLALEAVIIQGEVTVATMSLRRRLDPRPLVVAVLVAEEASNESISHVNAFIIIVPPTARAFLGLHGSISSVVKMPMIEEVAGAFTSTRGFICPVGVASVAEFVLAYARHMITAFESINNTAALAALFPSLLLCELENRVVISWALTQRGMR